MQGDRFKVGTFNLYNLALPQRRYYDQTYSKGDYQRKVTWIREQLERMDSDIVGFQEIFHSAALREVTQSMEYYQDASLVVGGETGDSPVVGLLSRLPIQDYETIAEFPDEAKLQIEGLAVPITQFSHPVLRVSLRLRPATKLVVFVLHLKSKNPMIAPGVDRHDPIERALGKARSLIRRAAEATAVRCLLVDFMRNNDDPVLLMGDINDTGHAVTSEIMTGSPPWRNLSFEKKLRAWDMLLYNVKDIQARQSYRDIYYTHIHNGHYESLDHIMVSQEFVRQNPRHIGYVEYVKVFNDHLLDDTLSDEEVPKWQSDHAQIAVTIRLRD